MTSQHTSSSSCDGCLFSINHCSSPWSFLAGSCDDFSFGWIRLAGFVDCMRWMVQGYLKKLWISRVSCVDGEKGGKFIEKMSRWGRQFMGRGALKESAECCLVIYRLCNAKCFAKSHTRRSFSLCVSSNHMLGSSSRWFFTRDMKWNGSTWWHIYHG